MKQKTQVIVTKWDKNLFIYLHANKIASLEQIIRHLPKYSTKHSLNCRLWRLRKAGFIYADNYMDEERKKVFGITKKTFDSFLPTHDESPCILSSGKMKHDLELGDIRSIFKNVIAVTNYYSENQLETWPDLLKEINAESVSSFNLDAFFNLNIQDIDHNVGLQHEISLKSKKRYRDIFQAFYDNHTLSAVFYICGTSTIKNYLIKVEKEVVTTTKRKIYYKSLCELKQSHTLKFINANSKVIQLEKKMN